MLLWLPSVFSKKEKNQKKTSRLFYWPQKRLFACDFAVAVLNKHAVGLTIDIGLELPTGFFVTVRFILQPKDLLNTTQPGGPGSTQIYYLLSPPRATVFWSGSLNLLMEVRKTTRSPLDS